MVVSLGYRIWRAMRVFMVVLVLTVVYVVLAWLLYAFYDPATTRIVLVAAFPFALLFAIGLIGSSEDASAKWQRSQLLASRELYSTLYEQSPVPYLTVNARGQVETCNMAAARLFGVTVAELKGQNILERLDSDDDTKLSVVLGKIQSKSSVIDAELRIKTFGDNAERWVLFSLFFVQTFDQQLVAMVDITHQKLVDKAKTEFVSLATHQLRTPVAALRWNVELLARSLRGISNEKQASYLYKIDRNVIRMLALINDFLSVSKLETGSFSTTPESIPLASYLKTIVDEYQQPILEKQINLVQSYVPDTLTITTDQRLFHIITSNLLSNAVKYVSPSDTIRFGYQLDGQYVVLTVADTGIGIPVDQQGQLFSKFFRASNAMLHKAEGTGLGLYIVKESVEKLGGTIAVESAEGQGTTFTVRLPIA